jgi:twinkle protein
MNRLEEVAEKLDISTIPNLDFDAYFKATNEDTQKIKLVAEYTEEMEAHINNADAVSGTQFPFKKLHGLFGFRDSEVTLWTGYNGHKKSMLLGYVVLRSFIAGNEPACIASFEMKPVKTIARMVRQFSSKQNPDENDYADFIEHVGKKLYILDQMGGMTPNRLYGVITYCAKELGLKHFVIDSLMRVVPGEDDHNAQKDFVVKLCEISNATGIHIHIVHHVKKGKESEPSGRYDAKGSGAISDNVHNSLVVWSNKEGIKDMPDVILKCDKQREGEWEGKIALNFERESLRFNEAFSTSHDE